MASTEPSGENFMWLISFLQIWLHHFGRMSLSRILTVPSLQPITMVPCSDTPRQRAWTESGRNFYFYFSTSGFSLSLNFRSTQATCSLFYKSQILKVPSSEHVRYCFSS